MRSMTGVTMIALTSVTRPEAANREQRQLAESRCRAALAEGQLIATLLTLALPESAGSIRVASRRPQSCGQKQRT
jgi:hypothetical protein